MSLHLGARRGLLTAPATTAAAPSSAIYWINLRATVGTGDPADNAWCSGGSYPNGTVGPYTFGYGSTGNAANAIDNAQFSSSIHNRGRISMTTGLTTQELQISGLTVGNDYNIYMALGALTVTVANGYSLYSQTGAAGTNYANLGGISVDQSDIMDAMGTTFNDPTAWLAGQAPRVITNAASTSLFIQKQGGGSNCYLQAVGIEDLG